jgi:NTP pyrophosphatase (non-canonical NTP hydrolase)
VEFNEYRIGCLRTWKPSGEFGKDLDHLAFGLLEEAGEVAGKFKRAYRDDDGRITEERRQQLLKECGDVLWYLTMLVDHLGYNIEEVAEDNLAKLADRQQRGVIKGDGDDR